jgi:hypothetical protein
VVDHLGDGPPLLLLRVPQELVLHAGRGGPTQILAFER